MAKADLNVIIERLDNLKAENSKDHSEISLKLKEIYNNHEERIKALEMWKVGFVAKFAVYSAIALFLGSLVAQIGIALILKMF